jgi:hypothetical protein
MRGGVFTMPRAEFQSFDGGEDLLMSPHIVP